MVAQWYLQLLPPVPPTVIPASRQENSGSFPQHTTPFPVPCLTHSSALRGHPLLFGRPFFPSDTCLGWRLLWEAPMRGSMPCGLQFATTLWTLQESAYLQDQLIIGPGRGVPPARRRSPHRSRPPSSACSLLREGQGARPKLENVPCEGPSFPRGGCWRGSRRAREERACKVDGGMVARREVDWGGAWKCRQEAQQGGHQETWQ